MILQLSNIMSNNIDASGAWFRHQKLPSIRYPDAGTGTRVPKYRYFYNKQLGVFTHGTH